MEDSFEILMQEKIEQAKSEIASKNCDQIEKTVLISQVEAYYDALVTYRLVKKGL